MGPHSDSYDAPDYPNSYVHHQSHLVPNPSLLQLATVILPGESQHIYGAELSLVIGLGCTIKVNILLCCPGILIGLRLFMQERRAFIFSSQLHMT